MKKDFPTGMMNTKYDENELLRLLDRGVYNSKGDRLQKLIKSPGKIAISAYLELLSRFLNKALHVKARTFWNERINVEFPEIVSLALYRYGYFEEGLTKFILHYLKPGMTFFDIGAHFGYFTLLSSMIVGNNGRVHSFEPARNTFKILESNVLPRRNITLNNCALLSKRGKIVLNDYGSRYSAFNSIFDARMSKETVSKMTVQRYEIDTISVDEYVDQSRTTPNFIKIDAESSEYEILLGMTKTIHDHRPIISIEVGDAEINGVPSNGELITFLCSKNYKVYEYQEKIIEHQVKKDKYVYDNLLFLPCMNGVRS